ncbi:unnamed protein product [Closterium sp. Naga37s-1]|nr:unnamed protein product [Closterium sp. Naga37s-1]
MLRTLTSIASLVLVHSCTLSQIPFPPLNFVTQGLKRLGRGTKDARQGGAGGVKEGNEGKKRGRPGGAGDEEDGEEGRGKGGR